MDNPKYAVALLLGVGLITPCWCQNTDTSSGDRQTRQTQTAAKHVKNRKSEPSPGRQVANGTGNIAGGTGKGAGDLAKGTGKGAADLVTLHPVDAAGSVGKGAAGAGKDVGVGTAKGTGKVFKGVGRGIKHIF